MGVRFLIGSDAEELQEKLKAIPASSTVISVVTFNGKLLAWVKDEEERPKNKRTGKEG